MAETTVTPERFLLSAEEQERTGWKYKWDVIQAEFIGQLKKRRELTYSQYAIEIGVHKTSLCRIAKKQQWREVALGAAFVKAGDQAETVLAKAVDQIRASVNTMARINAHIDRKLREKKIDPVDLKRLSDAASTVADQLRLITNQPTAISANTSFKFVIVRAETRYSGGQEGAGIPAMGVGSGGGQDALPGNFGRPENTQNGLLAEIGVAEVDQVAGGGGGVVPRTNVPTSENGSVATVDFHDPKAVDSAEVGRGPGSGDHRQQTVCAEGVRQL